MNHNDPRSLLATSPMSSLQIIVCTVAVLLNALDGFDLLAISFATPGIMKDFGLKASTELGVVLAADLVGMAIGSFVLGGIADLYGRRRAILGFLLVMTVGMYSCSHADSKEVLAAWRFFTGLGIGGMLAAINAAAAEFSNDRLRKFWVALMTIGLMVLCFRIDGNAGRAMPAAALLRMKSRRFILLMVSSFYQ